MIIILIEYLFKAHLSSVVIIRKILMIKWMSKLNFSYENYKWFKSTCSQTNIIIKNTTSDESIRFELSSPILKTIPCENFVSSFKMNKKITNSVPGKKGIQNKLSSWLTKKMVLKKL